MSPQEAASAALIGLGTLVLVVASLGVALPRDLFVRLHYLSLAAMAGAPLVLLGVLVHDPADWFKLVLIAMLLVASSPVGSAASARAIARSSPRSGGSPRGRDA
ncbi:MAG: monovalent cation/H(+) antiporter subunit G [Nocardioides sp.]|nr:monovalent cation/H(+) antiporter subunit G [Nocardioides sp.]